MILSNFVGTFPQPFLQISLELIDADAFLFPCVAVADGDGAYCLTCRDLSDVVIKELHRIFLEIEIVLFVYQHKAG